MIKQLADRLLSHILTDVQHDMLRYRRHRKWLKRQKKQIRLLERRIETMTTSSDKENRTYMDALWQLDRLRGNISPYAHGELEYTNQRVEALARKRDRIQRWQEALRS